MPRRGQCRCGAVLTVSKTAEGYKQRCPACHAVVRIRGHKKKRKQSKLHGPQPLPIPPAPPLFDGIPVPPPFAAQPNAVRTPTLEPWTEPAAPRFRSSWIILVAVVVAVLGVGGLIGWLIS